MTARISITLISVLSWISFFLPSCEQEKVGPVVHAGFTAVAENITFSEAVLKGALLTGTEKIMDGGFVWSTVPSPAVGLAQEKHVGAQNKDKEIRHELTGLQSNTIYYFRTFLILESGTVYGDELSFKTLQYSEFKTWSAEGVSFTEAILTGELSKHDDEIFDCGFVWSTVPNPTTANADKKYFGPQSSNLTFSHKLRGLGMNTPYYFRTFIISASGISYGEELSFTTLPEITWPNPGGFPGQARMGAVSFTVGSNAYVGLGHGHDENDHTIYFKDFWQFDMLTNIWIQKKDFPGEGRSGAVGFAVNSKGYVGTGGSPTGGTKDFWEYNPATNEWTQKADFMGGNLGWAVGFSMDDKGYVGTGVDNGNGEFLKTFYEYNPATDAWSRKADFPGLAVDQAVGFSIGEYGYIGMGLRAESWLGHTKQLWAYLPASNTWTRKKDCPSTSSLDGSIAFVLNNKAYVGLGWSSDKTIWAYNPDVDDWEQDGEFSGTYRIGAVAFIAGSKPIIGTGATSSIFLNDFVEYSPK